MALWVIGHHGSKQMLRIKKKKWHSTIEIKILAMIQCKNTIKTNHNRIEVLKQ